MLLYTLGSFFLVQDDRREALVKPVKIPYSLREQAEEQARSLAEGEVGKEVHEEEILKAQFCVILKQIACNI